MKYDIYLTGEIGWNFIAEEIILKIQEKKETECHLFISSLGGDLCEALKLFEAFKEHGNVIVHLFGFNASAATIMAMGAKKIIMSQFALFLVHNCSTYSDSYGFLNAEELNNKIEELSKQKEVTEKFDEVMANIYAAKTGKEVGEIVERMKEAKWLTADEALELGFIDSIEEEGERNDTQMSTTLKAQFVAKGYPLPSEGRKERVRAKDSNLLQRVATALGLSMPKEEEEPAPIPDETNEEMRKELQEKNSTIAQLTERVRAMERQIEKLGREDGDSSTKVEPQESPKAQSTQNARATYQQIKRMMKI